MDKIKGRLYDLSKMIIVFLITITVLYALMCLVYLIPNNVIKQNVGSAITNFKKEGERYSSFFIEGTNISKSLQLDNFSDAVILGTIIDECKEDKTIFEKALMNERFVNEERRPYIFL